MSGIHSVIALVGAWIFGDHKAKWPLIGMMIFGLGFVGCAVWYWSALKDIAPESPSNNPPSPESLTLEYCFEHDSPLGSFQRGYDLSVKDTPTNLDIIVPLRIRLYYDFTSHSEFLSVYMPLVNNARLQPSAIIGTLRDRLIAIREQMHSSVVMGQSQPGIPYSNSSDLVFSGRVFLYTPNPLNPVQIGDLVKWYQQTGLYLEIRGSDYLHFKRATAK